MYAFAAVFSLLATMNLEAFYQCSSHVSPNSLRNLPLTPWGAHIPKIITAFTPFCGRSPRVASGSLLQLNQSTRRHPSLKA
jgi:hypothetical protein